MTDARMNLHDACVKTAEDAVEARCRVNRELGFDRGVSVICSLLMQLGMGPLAMEYVTNLMATPLGEKLASMDYEQREQVIKLLDAKTGKGKQ